MFRPNITVPACFREQSVSGFILSCRVQFSLILPLRNYLLRSAWHVDMYFIRPEPAGGIAIHVAIAVGFNKPIITKVTHERPVL